MGNYYSLRGQHEKVRARARDAYARAACRVASDARCALRLDGQPQREPSISDPHSLAPLQAVLYFRRALRLDPHYLSAWTLMGHEHVEMKNPAAAIGMPKAKL